jgi:hypothetical protein
MPDFGKALFGKALFGKTLDISLSPGQRPTEEAKRPPGVRCLSMSITRHNGKTSGFCKILRPRQPFINAILEYNREAHGLLLPTLGFFLLEQEKRLARVLCIEFASFAGIYEAIHFHVEYGAHVGVVWQEKAAVQ